jgi:hypothetical protein
LAQATSITNATAQPNARQRRPDVAHDVVSQRHQREVDRPCDQPIEDSLSSSDAYTGLEPRDGRASIAGATVDRVRKPDVDARRYIRVCSEVRAKAARGDPDDLHVDIVH